MLTQKELIIDAIYGFFWIWLIHLLPIIIVGIPVWLLARERVKWNKWDFLIVIVPFLVWSALMFTHNKGKGIGNITEGLLIGCFTPIAPIIRTVVRDKMNQVILSVILLIFLTLLAIGFWAFIPGTIE